MKIGTFILGMIMVTFAFVAIGNLIGVNDINNVNDNVYTSDFRNLFGGVDKELVINPTEALTEFTNITQISAASAEDGSFEEYKLGNKVDSAKVSIWTQGTNVVKGFFGFAGLSLLQSLLIGLIAVGLIIGGIEFIRRSKL